MSKVSSVSELILICLVHYFCHLVLFQIVVCMLVNYTNKEKAGIQAVILSVLVRMLFMDTTDV